MNRIAIPLDRDHPPAPPVDLCLARKAGKHWTTLPASVRARFLKYVGPEDSVIYRGHVETSRRNWAGAVLIQLLRCIGAPLPLDTNAANEPAVVSITRHHDSGGQIWTRQYGRKNGLPQIIHSVKAFAGPTGLWPDPMRWSNVSVRLGRLAGLIPPHSHSKAA